MARPYPSRSCPTFKKCPVTSIQISYCGEIEGKEYPTNPEFVPTQGVSLFNVANTSGAILNNSVRSVELNEMGLWAGYFPTGENQNSGITFYRRPQWIDCSFMSAIQNQTINDIKTDERGYIWVATEQAGISMYDGSQWTTFTTDNGLPSNGIFGLTIDKESVWAATWLGIAKFDGERWSVPYSVENNTLSNDHTHAIAFDNSGNIWVGHMRNAGISHYRNSDGKWHSLTTATSEIGGNEIRDIVVREADGDMPESVWIATDDGGISRFEGGEWTVYTIENGLPSNHISALAIDKYNRVWAATQGGVVYQEGAEWIIYNSLPTLSIAFAPECTSCPFEDGEHVWTGTAGFGLTHSRLPYWDNLNVLQVQDICFVSLSSRERVCAALETMDGGRLVRAINPQTLSPEEKFRVEIFLIPHSPYQLKEGDFLTNLNENGEQLFGIPPHMEVVGVVDSGEPYRFTSFDNPFIAPQVANGEQEQTFTSAWRMWMHTRFGGPTIHLVFTVQRS